MTREVRPVPGGQPRLIDHGHVRRKTVYYVITVLALPLTLAQLAAARVAGWLSAVAEFRDGLWVWSHPCLYEQPPRAPAPELDPQWPRTRSQENGASGE
jgi:hypothetical protein